jgi:hypothetical protein
MADNTRAPACPLPATVTVPGPVPATNGCQGTVNLGGNGAIDWSAPNAKNTAAFPPTGSTGGSRAVDRDVSSSGIGGGGAMTVTGAFFTPNCDPVQDRRWRLADNGANAQFITRRLEVTATASSSCARPGGRGDDPGRAGNRPGALSRSDPRISRHQPIG